MKQLFGGSSNYAFGARPSSRPDAATFNSDLEPRLLLSSAGSLAYALPSTNTREVYAVGGPRRSAAASAAAAAAAAASATGRFLTVCSSIIPTRH